MTAGLLLFHLNHVGIGYLILIQYQRCYNIGLTKENNKRSRV